MRHQAFIQPLVTLWAQVKTTLSAKVAISFIPISVLYLALDKIYFWESQSVAQDISAGLKLMVFLLIQSPKSSHHNYKPLIWLVLDKA